MSRARILMISSALCLASGIAQPALAQDAAGEGGLDDIVVTAERRETNVQDVPSAITALSAETLENAHVRTLSELSLIAPGVQFLPVTTANTYLSIRGTQIGVDVPGADQAVGFFLDDVYIAGTTGLSAQMYDLQRAEVLRGPQGTLFGRNVSGGAVLLYTQAPTFEPEAQIRVTAGEFGLRQVQGFISGALAPGQAAGRLTVDYYGHDGFYNAPALHGEQQQRDDITLRGQLLLTPTDKFSLRLGLIGEQRNDGAVAVHFDVAGPTGAPYQPLGFPGVRNGGNDIVYTTPGYEDTEHVMFTARADWEFPVGTLTSITAARDQDLDQFRESVGAPGSAPLIIPSHFKRSDRQVSQEIRFASPGGAFFDYVVGLYYLDQESSSDLNGTFFGFVNQNAQSIDATSVAVFGEGVFNFTDTLRLTLGGRYTSDEKSGVSSRFLVPAGANYSNIRYSDSWDAFTPKASLSFDVTPDFMAFLTYSEGFKSGGFGQDATTAAGVRTPFDPETAENIELGFKSRWLDNRLQVNASAYHVEYDGLQQRGTVVQGGLVVLTTTNVGGAEVQGVDFEALARLNSNIDVGFNYTYTDSEVTRVSAGGNPTSLHKQLLNTPEQTAAFFTDVHFPVGDNGGQIRLHADYTWRDTFYVRPDNSDPAWIHEKTEYSGVVNLQAQYETGDGRWAFAVFGRNITDERTIFQPIDVSTTYLSAGERGAGNTAWSTYYLQPAYYGMSLTFNFFR